MSVRHVLAMALFGAAAVFASPLSIGAARAQGGRFDLKAYHGQVLDTGALPMAVLEAKVDRWLAARN